MKFSYSEVWEDTIALLRAHGTLMVAIAGAFAFLPTLLLDFFLPPPAPSPGDASEAFQMIVDYYRGNALWFLLDWLLTMVATLAIQRLVLARDTTVSAAIGTGAAVLPFYLLASLIGGLIIGFGLFLLILPGLYLMARLTVVGPVLVAEPRRNPIDVISRSFQLTRNRGWAILGLLVLIFVAGVIVMRVAIMLFGIVFSLLAGDALERLLMAIVTSAVGAAFTVLMAVVYAAIYRAISGGAASTARVFE
jgi:hypothetical protein